MKRRNYRGTFLACDHRLDPLLHLSGGLVRKGDSQDRSGPHARMYQVGGPHRDDPCLARSRTRQYKEWPLGMFDRFLLSWVKARNRLLYIH